MEVQSEPRPADEGRAYPGMRFYRGVMAASGAIGALLFGLMALVICIDVVFRNLGIFSISWALEGSEYMLMAAAFLGAPWLVYTNDHIRVDIVVRMLPNALARLCDVLVNIICLAISGVIAYEAIVNLLDSAEQGGVVLKVMVFPVWWLSIPIVISFVLLTIEFVRRMVCTVVRGRAA